LYPHQLERLTAAIAEADSTGFDYAAPPGDTGARVHAEVARTAVMGDPEVREAGPA
jgi:hypothetical protein